MIKARKDLSELIAYAQTERVTLRSVEHYAVLATIGAFVLAVALFVGRGYLRDRRARAGIDAEAYGLVPRERLDPRRSGPPRAEPDTKAAVEAAWDGEWEPAAALIEAAGEDWDLRCDRLRTMSYVAVEDERWLLAWRAARPQDGTAVAVHAEALLHRAWEARGTEYSDKTSDEQAAAFHKLLPTAFHAAQEAARLAPRDPAPWVTMITAARGLNTPNEEFRRLWAELRARAPYHYDGHWQALQYWCEKWHGSNRLMLDFAKETVEYAPSGSALPAIYLHGLNELWRRQGDEVFVSRGVRPVVRTVREKLTLVPDDDPRLPAIRHLLAAALVKGGSHAEALEEFRRIGPWCGAEPWTRSGEPVLEFDRWRAVAALRA